MSNPTTIICADEQAMQALGAQLMNALRTEENLSNNLLTLTGELGAGKSFLARAMIHAAGYDGRVKSPTYTLIETYEIKAHTGLMFRIAHLDLYRLADPDELHYLGFDDVLDTHDLVLIEWPDKAGDLLPDVGVEIDIEYVLPAGRRVSVSGVEGL